VHRRGWKPRKIKKLSQDLDLVPNWDVLKLEVMQECLELKFAQEPFRTWLLETGGAHIQEGNGWGDTFWGVDVETNQGENNLGLLIMEIREELKEASIPSQIEATKPNSGPD